MKIYQWIVALTLATSVSGCIADEAPNAEADIVSATLADQSKLNREPIVENDRVTYYVNYDVNLATLAPEFILTPGATIEPASGTVLNFSDNMVHKYTVTSEDGKWTKTYSVAATYPSLDNLEYNFDNVRLNTSAKVPYDVFYETNSDGVETMTWASGNPGFALAGALLGITSSQEYPTYQIAEGRTGKALALTTRTTGKYGAQLKSPIAAGNLFMGTFQINIVNTLLSTHFGSPFTKLPTYIEGYFKYKAGPTFFVKDEKAEAGMVPVPGKVDKPNIYAVFYRTTDEVQYLTGENVLSDDNPLIVATAVLPASFQKDTDQWTRFYIPFTYRDGAAVDFTALAAGKYNITLVFSSSAEGDNFSGAPGSTLIVDDVKLGCVEATQSTL